MRVKELSVPQILLRLIWVSLVIFIVVQILDVLTTIRFVRRFGIDCENSELGRSYFALYGVAGLWLTKLSVVPIIVAASCTLSLVSKKLISNKKDYKTIVLLLSFILFLNTCINIRFIVVAILNNSIIP